MENVTCKICIGKSAKLFTTLVLEKHNITYYKCVECNFIQTEEPFWLDEAYSSAITSLDLGLINRNLQFIPIVTTIIKTFFNKEEKFIDYGGGYGMFVRLMRDEGFDYYRQDIYCENLFSRNFDVTDLSQKNKFELLTAFEVVEHLVNPLMEIKLMLSYSDNLFFTTSLYPESEDLLNWWYLAPQTGQHISLYSKKSLQFLAGLLGVNYTNIGIYHFFTKDKLSYNLLEKCFDKEYQNKLNQNNKNPPSLLVPDFNKVSRIKIKN